MTYKTLLGKSDFLESLRGKTASFYLSASYTQSADIEGISQAGLKGLLHLTPVLDFEFLCVQEVRSLENIAVTPSGIPTPAIITRAVHTLKAFSSLEFLDLGVKKLPKLEHFPIHNFDISFSHAINTKTTINAFDIFQKGLEFGKTHKSPGEYTILAESVPAGTTTANALCLALGYEVENKFSSSFKNAPNKIKDTLIKEALVLCEKKVDIFEKAAQSADNMLIFNAGFVLGQSSTNKKLILAGGTQMAAVLLLVNSIVKEMNVEFDASNLAICTTKWLEKDENSDFIGILKLLDFNINAYASTFDFQNSSSKVLKKYDEGEAKEGVGAGAALCYAAINNIKEEELLEKIQHFVGE